MPLLEVKGLKQQLGHGPEIKGVNLEAGSGAIVGLIGSNYPSRVLRMLAGLVALTVGMLFLTAKTSPI